MKVDVDLATATPTDSLEGPPRHAKTVGRPSKVLSGGWPDGDEAKKRSARRRAGGRLWPAKSHVAELAPSSLAPDPS